MINVTYPAQKSGLIQIVDGLLDEKLCQAFIERMNELWNENSFDGETVGGVDIKSKNSRDLRYQPSIEKWCQNDVVFDQQIFDALFASIAIYKQTFNHLDNWTDIADSGFQIQRYLKLQGFYRTHIDSFPIMNSSSNNRVLAAIIYLNSVEFGGETNFPLHNIAVTPKAGRIVLFPAVWTHPHECCVSISEDKWIISSFILNSPKTPVEITSEHHNNNEILEDHEHLELEEVFGI